MPLQTVQRATRTSQARAVKSAVSAYARQLTATYAAGMEAAPLWMKYTPSAHAARATLVLSVKLRVAAIRLAAAMESAH